MIKKYYYIYVKKAIYIKKYSRNLVKKEMHIF